MPLRLRAASPDASFDAFARSALPELLRFGLLLTGNRASAEDLVQTALERTLRRWRSIDANGNPLGYARTIMVRVHVDAWRRFGRREFSAEHLPEELGSAAPDHAGPISDRMLVLDALAGLAPRQRAVVVLRYYGDLSEAQIADILGCSVGTVKSQASRALGHMRRRMLANSATSSDSLHSPVKDDS